MTIRRFTAAYDLAKGAVKDYGFAESWKAFLETDAGVKSVFADTAGPQQSQAPKFDKLRAKIAEKKTAGTSEGAVILEMVGVNADGTQAMTAAASNAAGAIKMMRHIYLVKEAGAQCVWIFAQPYSFHKWVFDELAGISGSAAKTKLGKVDEVYPADVRGHMGKGVTQALNWCQKCVAKLGTPDEKTLATVKTWFAPDTAGEANACKTLLDGFKKVSALLQSNKLIFSDEPINRMTGDAVAGQSHYRSDWNDYAFVDAAPRERLDVVYIQNATLKKWGSADDGWMATLAVIHELSHRVLETKDVVYDFTGLKPNDKLTFEHAIKNADSWAYFAADISGQLTQSVREKYYKGPAQLRQRYLDSLTG